MVEDSQLKKKKKEKIAIKDSLSFSINIRVNNMCTFICSKLKVVISSTQKINKK